MGLLQRILREKRYLVLPLAIAAVTNLAAYGLIVSPLAAKARGAEGRDQAAARTLQDAERDFADAKAMLSGKDRAQTELQKFYKEILPANLAGARRITFLRLDQLSRQAHLSYQQRTFERKQEPGGMLGKLLITLVLQGAYENIRQFIYQLETAPEFLVIEDISLAEGTQNTDRLELTLQLSTYFRTVGDGT